MIVPNTSALQRMSKSQLLDIQKTCFSRSNRSLPETTGTKSEIIARITEIGSVIREAEFEQRGRTKRAASGLSATEANTFLRSLPPLIPTPKKEALA